MLRDFPDVVRRAAGAPPTGRPVEVIGSVFNGTVHFASDLPASPGYVLMPRTDLDQIIRYAQHAVVSISEYAVQTAQPRSRSIRCRGEDRDADRHLVHRRRAAGLGQRSGPGQPLLQRRLHLRGGPDGGHLRGGRRETPGDLRQGDHSVHRGLGVRDRQEPGRPGRRIRHGGQSRDRRDGGGSRCGGRQPGGLRPLRRQLRQPDPLLLRRRGQLRRQQPTLPPGRPNLQLLHLRDR